MVFEDLREFCIGKNYECVYQDDGRGFVVHVELVNKTLLVRLKSRQVSGLSDGRDHHSDDLDK